MRETEREREREIFAATAPTTDRRAGHDTQRSSATCDDGQAHVSSE
jgi:hypothetical protein